MRHIQIHLDYLLAMDPKEYSNRNKELMEYLDIFSSDNPPMKKLENIIKELISDSKIPISRNRWFSMTPKKTYVIAEAGVNLTVP